MIREVYEALREAGVSEEKALRAAEALAVAGTARLEEQLQRLVTREEFDRALQRLDERLATLVTKEHLDERLKEFVTLEQLDERLRAFAAKEDLFALKEELRNEIQGVREELRAGIQGVREELRNEIQGVREELRAEIQGVREEVHKLDARLSGVEARLGSMQWLLGLIFAGIVALIFRVFLFGG